MIKTHQILRKGTSVLLGIGTDNAVLDVLTNDAFLRECVKLLEERGGGLLHTQMGTFGACPVTLNVHDEKTVSIFIDGPDFESTRTQSAAIWLEKDELRNLLVEIVRGAS